VNIADGRALNFVDIGSLTVTKQGGTPKTATPVLPPVSNGNKLGTVTYTLTFDAPLSPVDNGTYTVDLPANAIKDAAGNAAAAATLGTFALNVGSATDPDLVAEVTAKFPAGTLIIGPKAKGAAKVKIINQGQTAITKAPVPVTLYLSDNPTKDAADIPLATQTKPLTLKTGKSKSLAFKFTYPANAGNGSYFLIAEADTGNTLTEANEANNVAITPKFVTLAQPLNDLSVGTVSRPVGALTPNGKAAASVNVVNNGNVTFNQNLSIRLTASSDNAADASDTVITTFTKKVSIKPGATKAVPIKFTFPAALPAGTYFMVVELDPNLTILETHANNFGSSDSFAVA
jgi:hypothetical protein